jgi:hypothetical protein
MRCRHYNSQNLVVGDFTYEGLNNGMLVTTLNHNEEFCQAIVNPVTGELIGEIISQEAKVNL